MVIVRNWLNERLNVIELNSAHAIKTQRVDMVSRLGPEQTICDIDFTSTVRISADRLSLRSQGSFNTIKANVCVYGGRWMYEVSKVIYAGRGFWGRKKHDIPCFISALRWVVGKVN